MSKHKRELVVFLPAVGGAPSSWEPQRSALEASYATLCVAFDHSAEEVSIERFATHVAHEIRRAGYAKAHLVGLSMGGVVALEVFRRFRPLVRSLAVANSWAHQPEASGKLAWFDGEIASRGLAGFSALTMPELFAPQTAQAIKDEAVRVESAKDERAYRAAWHAMLPHDHRDILHAIDVPTLLVGGEHDNVTPTSLLRVIADAVHGSRLVEIEDAGHFSNLDAPERFTQLLVTHLRSARGADDRAEQPLSSSVNFPAETTSTRILRLLDARGVECFFSNSGTDFTPIIESLATLEGELSLRVVAAPHENTAIAMAHGHALLSRRAQCAMAHVNVGTANMGLGLINARRARVPLMLFAGRTPWFEQGMDGTRSNFVQWGQESFDQGAMFREFTKWDYELRRGHNVETVIDRAFAISESDPKGPVYCVLPKEPLCEQLAAVSVSAEPRQRASRATVPSNEALDEAARAILSAKSPLIVTADAGRHSGAAAALVAFARAAGAGVVEHGKRNFYNFPTEAPLHLGFEPNALVRECDLLIAVECPVPYIPAFAKLERAPKVLSIAVDPLFSDLPLRGFPSDLSLAGDPTETLRALATKLRDASDSASERLASIEEKHKQIFSAARTEAAGDSSRERISKRYLSHTIGAVLDDDCVVFNEYDLDPMLVPRGVADSWYENSVASGLGWALGASLGAKIAAPERTMVVTVGDGSYLFNTPLSAHHAAATEGLSVLVVVFDDQAWSTIKRSTKGSHPGGVAAKKDSFALCDFDVAVDYAAIARACGGIGITVEKPSELRARTAEALATARSHKGLVLLHVKCERDG